MLERRLSALREALPSELDALLVTQPENRRYMSGFTGSSGVLMVSRDEALLATDFRYYEQVRQQTLGWELLPIAGRPESAIAQAIAKRGWSRLGFERENVTVGTLERWREAMPQVRWIGTEDTVENLRQVKDEAEIGAIMEAVRLADEAMAHIYDWLRPGVTEREVSWELETHMRTHGASRLSFTTIVASGANGAMSHAVTTDRPIERGDPVVIDMGCVVDGYCSDLTRSFCLGTASEPYREIWDTVLQAQLAAEAGIRAGMTGVAADSVARDIINGAGHQDHFGHGLGHGVGLAIHESPRASQLYPGALPDGCVLTVEPGIYLPGWGGVRIEDMVIVETDGCRVLTQVAKEPVVGGSG